MLKNTHNIYRNRLFTAQTSSSKLWLDDRLWDVVTKQHVVEGCSRLKINYAPLLL